MLSSAPTNVGICSASFFCMAVISDELSIMNRMSTLRSLAAVAVLAMAAISVSAAGRSGEAHETSSAQAKPPSQASRRVRPAPTEVRQRRIDHRRALRRLRRRASRNATSNVRLQAPGPEAPTSQPPSFNPLVVPSDRAARTASARIRSDAPTVSDPGAGVARQNMAAAAGGSTPGAAAVYRAPLQVVADHGGQIGEHSRVAGAADRGRDAVGAKFFHQLGDADGRLAGAAVARAARMLDLRPQLVRAHVLSAHRRDPVHRVGRRRRDDGSDEDLAVGIGLERLEAAHQGGHRRQQPVGVERFAVRQAQGRCGRCPLARRSALCPAAGSIAEDRRPGHGTGGRTRCTDTWPSGRARCSCCSARR